MPRIVIDVLAHYDWEPAIKGYRPTDDEIRDLKYKPAVNDVWLKRVVTNRKTHTTVEIPEQQIVSLAAAGHGRPGAIAMAVAASMRHNAHPDHWTNITVDDDPALAAFLKFYFGVKEPKE